MTMQPIARQSAGRLLLLGFLGAIVGQLAGLAAGVLMGSLFDGLVFAIFLAPLLWPGYLVVILLMAGIFIPAILLLLQRCGWRLGTLAALMIAASVMAISWLSFMIMLSRARGRT